MGFFVLKSSTVRQSIQDGLLYMIILNIMDRASVRIGVFTKFLLGMILLYADGTRDCGLKYCMANHKKSSLVVLIHFA